MLKPFIYPYKMGSKSAALLSSALQCKRVFPDRNYVSKRNHLVINWGNSTYPNWNGQLLNDPHNVGNAANKLSSFVIMRSSGVNVPRFTQLKDHTHTLGSKVACRTILTGHSGAGIVIASTPEELVDAPLYTQFINKDKEYRVHVFQGEVIDVQQKKKRRGEDCNSDVRNHANGWVYARSEVVLPEEVSTQAIKAVEALGLDFGAVDVCTEKITGDVYVFEVNTAPGIEGTTLEKYVEAFRGLL